MARIMFQGPSSVTDYSVAANHKNYFQFSFPTTGYDSINVKFSISGGQNLTDDYVELVYSTDGGKSWVDAGKYNMLSGWWLYKGNSVSISAKNKANVLLRLVANTASTSGSANFNLDYLTIMGKEFSAGGAVKTTGKITWPFTTGAAGQAATFSTGTEGYYSTNWVSVGSNMAYNSAKPDNGYTFTAFQPVATVGSAPGNEDYYMYEPQLQVP